MRDIEKMDKIIVMMKLMVEMEEKRNLKGKRVMVIKM